MMQPLRLTRTNHRHSVGAIAMPRYYQARKRVLGSGLLKLNIISRYLSIKSTMDGITISQIMSWETELSNIQGVLNTHRLDWRSCLPAARGIIALLDEDSPTTQQLDVQERISVTSTLQKLAYQDADTGGERDIALWCERQWATILQSHPDSVEALQGMLMSICRKIIS